MPRSIPRRYGNESILRNERHEKGLEFYEVIMTSLRMWEMG
jgi:hypothetical protein